MAVTLYVNDKPVDTIFYTMDGTTPTENSSVYITPLEIENSCTIKAFAVFDDGTIGPVSQAVYTVTPRLATPTFVPPSGANTPSSITINADPGAEIWYTVNGSTPSNTNGSFYSAPVDLVGTVTLKAIAYKLGFRKSFVATGYYAPPDYSFGQLPPVQFSPSNTTPLSFPIPVTMSCPGHPDATIIYRIGHTNPDYTDAVYPGTPVPLGGNGVGGVRAFAIKLKYAPSQSSGIIYTQAQANTPTFNPVTNTAIPLHSTVSMSNGQTGAVLYYTVDGSNPVPP